MALGRVGILGMVLVSGKYWFRRCWAREARWARRVVRVGDIIGLQFSYLTNCVSQVFYFRIKGIKKLVKDEVRLT